LDPTFGNGGRVVTEVRHDSSDYMSNEQAIAAAPDGKIVLAGATALATGPNDSGPESLALVRYLPDGSLDNTFGNGGIVTTTAGLTDSGGGISSVVISVEDDG